MAGRTGRTGIIIKNKDMEAKEVLKKHFNLAVEKYPNENWVNDFDSQTVEIEFITSAMEEYAKLKIDEYKQSQQQPIEPTENPDYSGLEKIL